jgi:hypothetical protein
MRLIRVRLLFRVPAYLLQNPAQIGCVPSLVASCLMSKLIESIRDLSDGLGLPPVATRRLMSAPRLRKGHRTGSGWQSDRGCSHQRSDRAPRIGAIFVANPGGTGMTAGRFL